MPGTAGRSALSIYIMEDTMLTFEVLDLLFDLIGKYLNRGKCIGKTIQFCMDGKVTIYWVGDMIRIDFTPAVHHLNRLKQIAQDEERDK